MRTGPPAPFEIFGPGVSKGLLQSNATSAGQAGCREGAAGESRVLALLSLCRSPGVTARPRPFPSRRGRVLSKGRPAARRSATKGRRTGGRISAIRRLVRLKRRFSSRTGAVASVIGRTTASVCGLVLFKGRRRSSIRIRGRAAATATSRASASGHGRRTQGKGVTSATPAHTGRHT